MNWRTSSTESSPSDWPQCGQESRAAGYLVALPRSHFQIRTAAGQPPFPIGAERLLVVFDLAPLDLFDQPTPSVPGGPFAGEPPLGGLRAIAAPVDEAPAHTIAGPVRVDPAAASMPGRIGSAGAGGDLDQGFIEGASRFLGGKPTCPTAALGIPPPHLPASSVEADAHEYVQRVATAGRWTY